MCRVDRVADRPTVKGNFGVNMGRPIVTNWDLSCYCTRT